MRDEQIEQAVFTSARTARRDGYHVVVKSPSADDDDVRELAKWGPTHDSLNSTCPASGSLNCHPLQSGNICVSRTVKAGYEYSQRGGVKIYTQSLILPLPVFQRFSNNPFRVSEAASAAGHWRVLAEFPDQLDPIRLIGRGSAVDIESLQELIQQVGVNKVAASLHAILSTDCLALRGWPAPHRLLSGLLSLLPPPGRIDFSLTTGLCFSPTREFRIIVLDPHVEQSTLARIRRVRNAGILDFDERQEDYLPEFVPWVRAMERILHSSSWDALLSFYQAAGNEIDISNLNQHADSLHDDIGTNPATPERYSERATIPISSPVPSHDSQVDKDCRFDAPVLHASGVLAEPLPSARSSGLGTARLLSLDEGPLLELLDQMDESVLAAINGSPEALSKVSELWTSVTAKLDTELLEESRNQYLVFALRNWLATDSVPDITRTAAAISMLDVLAILFSDGK